MAYFSPSRAPGSTPAHSLPAERWRRWPARLRHWLRPPRRIRATNTGKVMLVFTVLLGAAAVNTGNNLLYLILGSMFGLISASGILSERSMKSLEVGRRAPAVLFAGEPAELVYELNNPKKRADCYLIELFETNPAILISAPLFSRVPAGQKRTRRTILTVPTRGVYQLGELKIQTRYPFDFYERSYTVEAPDTLYAGPRPLRNAAAPIRPTEGSEGAVGRRGEVEFDRVRPLRAGDAPRLMHWKKTAALGSWQIRGGESIGATTASLYLPATGASELQLENLCGWVRHYLRQQIQVVVQIDNDSIQMATESDLTHLCSVLAVYPAAQPLCEGNKTKV